MLEIICSQDIGFDIPFPYSLLCIHSYNSVYVCLYIYIYATLPPVQNTVNTNTSKSTKRVGTGGGHHIYIYISRNSTLLVEHHPLKTDRDSIDSHRFPFSHWGSSPQDGEAEVKTEPEEKEKDAVKIKGEKIKDPTRPVGILWILWILHGSWGWVMG